MDKCVGPFNRALDIGYRLRVPDTMNNLHKPRWGLQGKLHDLGRLS